MILESDYTAYFENLATKHVTVAHSPQAKSFFYIANPYELTAIEDHLRNLTKKVVIMLDAPGRVVDDSASNNYVEKLECQFTVLKKENDRKKQVIARDEVLPIAEDFIVKIKKDQSAGLLFGNRLNRMKIANVKVEPVGPMLLEWYGHTVIVTLSCPFALQENSGNWLL